MRKIFSILILPLLIELSNDLVHELVREKTAAEHIQYVDIFSMGVTVIVLFFLGWRVAAAYSEKIFIKAGIYGTGLWFFSAVIFTGLAIYMESQSKQHGENFSLGGPLLAFVLFMPLAASIAMLGAFIKTRVSRNNPTIRDQI